VYVSLQYNLLLVNDVNIKNVVCATVFGDRQLYV